jgi:hypothetical protein
MIPTADIGQEVLASLSSTHILFKSSSSKTAVVRNSPLQHGLFNNLYVRQIPLSLYLPASSPRILFAACQPFSWLFLKDFECDVTMRQGIKMNGEKERKQKVIYCSLNYGMKTNMKTILSCILKVINILYQHMARNSPNNFEKVKYV